MGNLPLVMSCAARERLIASRKQEISVLLTPDIYSWYRQKLDVCRMAFDERRSAWMVLGYSEVQQVLLDTETFSSERTLKPDGSVDEILSAGMLGLDPPRHRRLRSLVAQAFTQKRVAALELRIRSLTAGLIDRMQDEDCVDIVDALAFPLPVMVIAELLGVPALDRDQFRSWTRDMVGTDYALRMQAFGKMGAYFDTLISDQKRDPRDTLISDLLAAQDDGEGLSREDVVGTCLLLLVAGHETTTSLIGNAFWCFDQHPKAREELLTQPEMLPMAIEEVLRFRSVLHWLPRVVRKDHKFLGHDLKEGDLVLPAFAAANRDGAQFPDPDHFDIRRSPNRHLGFGHGIHLCLGASLARLEARVALGEVLRRFPRMHRDEGKPSVLKPSSFVFAFDRYPVRLHG
jgi:cytochrome P450